MLVSLKIALLVLDVKAASVCTSRCRWFVGDSDVWVMFSDNPQVRIGRDGLGSARIWELTECGWSQEGSESGMWV